MTYDVNRADYCTPNGATMLLEVLAAYWRNKGFPDVTFRTETYSHGGVPVYCVRSNLVRGMAPSDTRLQKTNGRV